MVKILAIGDPHGYKNIKSIKVPKGIDVILITGDLGDSDIIRNYYLKAKEKGVTDWREAFSKKDLNKIYTKLIDSGYMVLDYFNQFNKPVYFVYGNVFGIDCCILNKNIKLYGLNVPKFENMIKKLKNVKDISLKKVKIQNVGIAGIPYFDSFDWIKRFDFKEDSRLKFAKIQEPKIEKFTSNLEQVDILLSHIPPYGILDKVTAKFAPKHWQGKHAGSKIILDYIKKKQLKYVFCGHIHEGEGMKKVGKTEVYNLGVAGHKIIDL